MYSEIESTNENTFTIVETETEMIVDEEFKQSLNLLEEDQEEYWN
jgi:hypothetical protein